MERTKKFEAVGKELTLLLGSHTTGLLCGTAQRIDKNSLYIRVRDFGVIIMISSE